MIKVKGACFFGCIYIFIRRYLRCIHGGLHIPRTFRFFSAAKKN